MSLAPAIVHLIGYPGVGKYTVAKGLVTATAVEGTHCVLMDNHATGNLILPILDLEGVSPIPREVWDRVGEVREVVYRTIEDLSPPAWSFVFTNVIVADDPGDRLVVPRLTELARASGRRYLPIRLHCDVEVLLDRVPDPERAARHKWVDADAVRQFIDTHTIVDVDALAIDTTTGTPEEAVRRIVDHWRGVTALP